MVIVNRGEHIVHSEHSRLLQLSILGSVAIMPLLILPTMVGALVDYTPFDESQAGWIAAIGSLGGAGAAIALGLRMRHLNPRMLAFTGLAILMVSDSLSAAVTQLPVWLFYGLRASSGIGGAIAYASVMASIAAMQNPERGYGVFVVIQFSLSGAGLYGLPFALPIIGVEGMYLLLAASAAVSFAFASAALDRKPVDAHDEPALELHILMMPAALLAMLGIGLFETANTMHFTYAERIGVDFGLANYRIGEILGIATIAGIPAGFGVIWLGNRLGDLVPILATLVIAIVALLLLITYRGAGVYTFAMCALGIIWAFGLPYFWAIEARLDPGGSVVVAGGFFTSAGAGLGPALAATLVGEHGYNGVLLVSVGIYLIVAILMWFCLRFANRSG